MIEYLIGYVNRLEEMMFNEQPVDGTINNSRYLTLMEMKKFILTDMLVYFVDKDIQELRTYENPTRDLVSLTINRWMDFCDKHEEYINKQCLKDYIVGQLIQEEK